MKRLISTVLAAALLLASVASLASCSDGKVRKSYYYEYFDTVSIISDYSGRGERKFRKDLAEVEVLLREYHELFDIYNEYDGINNLATLNSMAGKGPVKLDDRILDLLEYSVSAYELTGGEINVAFGAVLKIWHDYRSEGKAVPRRQELLRAERHCNIKDLVIDRENGTAELLDPEMRIDVGAVAKGYAVERIALVLADRGLSGWVLDVGGNLRVIGTKNDGTGWRTGVKNPSLDPNDPYIAYYELKDEALVTSGNYERYYEVGGERYHHIIDKDTLMPSEHCVSVTVRADDSALADALSTAIFNMDAEDAQKLIEKLGGRAEALIVLQSGEKLELKYTEIKK